MKKILCLILGVLTLGLLPAAQLNFIEYSLSSAEGNAGVSTPFNYARIVSTTSSDSTTYNQIVFGAGTTVARVGADDGTFLLTSDQAAAITSATSSSNVQFYFEFYNDSVIMGYSDYVSASALAASISSVNTSTFDMTRGMMLELTGYEAPEPSSCLLLLVGGALLGLRRRRKNG